MATPQIDSPSIQSSHQAPTLTLTPELARAVRSFANTHGLTNREAEVLEVLVEGTVSAVQIAERLGLSRNTVHNHIGNIFRRTRTNSKASVLAHVIHHMARNAATRPALDHRHLAHHRA